MGWFTMQNTTGRIVGQKAFIFQGYVGLETLGDFPMLTHDPHVFYCVQVLFDSNCSKFGK